MNLHNLFMQAPAAISILRGDDYVIEMVNKRMAEMWGREIAEVINRPAFVVLTELREQGFKGLLDNLYYTGETFVTEELPINLKRNGAIESIFIKFIYEPLRDDDGIITGVMGLAHEITDQVVARQKIAASEAFNRAVLESSPDCMKIIDVEGRLIFINGNGLCTLEIDDFSSVKGKHWWQLWGEDKRQVVKDAMAKALQGKTAGFQAFNLTVKGTPKWWDVVVTPVMEKADRNIISHMIAVSRNITEQKKSVQKLEESEHRFRNLVEKAPAPICILKGETMILEAGNNPVFKIWNVGEEAIGKPFLDIVPEMNGQPFMDYLLNVFHNGVTHYGYEEPAYLIGENGEKHTHYFNIVYQPYMGLGGTITGVMVAANDSTLQVTTRRKTEMQAVLVQELLMTAPGFIATLIGHDHVYDVVNEKYQQLFSKRKLKGLAIMKALPELEGQGFDTLLDTVFTTGVPYVGIDIPLTMARDENLAPELRYFNFSYQPIYYEEKTICSILVFCYEVTEQVIAKNKNLETQQIRSKELEENVRIRTHELNESNKLLQQKNDELSVTKEKLLSDYSRSLIEASLDPLIVISTGGKITDMNEALATVTGRSRDELIGTDFGIYFTDPQKALEIYREVFAKGFVTNYPLTIIDGELTDVLFNGSVYKDAKGKVLGAVVVARVITEQKRIEKELTEAKVYAELSTIVAEYAQSKAEEAMKAKQQFLSNMSHEIRTPMNAIIGFTKVVLRTDLSAKQREYLTAIKVSGDSLIVLINDILDLAKVNAGKMTFEQTPFKLALSVSAMLHLFETKIREKNLTLVKEYDNSIPQVIIGDPARLNQLILNLVGNAVKFTSKGKIKVGVRLVSEEKNNVTIEFSVADTGIGIAPDQLKIIFENFQQAHSSKAKLHEGTGLGLGIVKQLVELQGGSIDVQSTLHQGSVFRFRLSFQKTTGEAEQTIEPTELTTEIKNINVLVADDVELNQLLIKTLLDDFGFSCDITQNGKLALGKLAVKNYDIILMDLQMPEMNGFEATAYIRNNINPDIPIIALTADVTTVDLEKCKAAGMNDYIAKPVDEKLLYSKIVGLVTKAMITKANADKNVNGQINKIKYTNLDSLSQRTKSNPELMMQMISLYLEQNPPLILAMKESLKDKDWEKLNASVHKMIPSFSIMGIHPDFETMAIKIQEYVNTMNMAEDVHNLVASLENVCTRACAELEEEFIKIKTNCNE